MTKVSSIDDFKHLIGKILREKPDFLQSIRNLDDPFDFFAVYEKIARLTSSMFEIEITDSAIPFSMKFDLVILVMEMVYEGTATQELIEKIYSEFGDFESKILKEIKSDAKATIEIISLSCITGHFEFACKLLEHLHDNIGDIPRHYYKNIIQHTALTLQSLSSIIQEKLYDDKQDFLNQELVKFSFAAMGVENGEFHETEVYQRLVSEHPTLLNTYEQAVKTLKRFQTRSAILSL